MGDPKKRTAPKQEKAKNKIVVDLAYIENLLMVVNIGGGRQSMNPVLARIRGRELPAKMAYDIARALAKARIELKPFNETKEEVLKQNAEWDEARGGVKMDEVSGEPMWKKGGSLEKVNASLDELREQKVTLDMPPIRLDWNTTPNMTEEEMGLLLPLLADE